jgi:hypothetical protein
MGMQGYANLNGLLYSNTGITFQTGATLRDKDYPTGGTTRATLDSTGLTVTGIANISGNITGGNILTTGRVISTPIALANLTAVAGGRAFVNDANLIAAGNFGNQVGGSGSNTVPVWSDGTNWYIG